MGTSGNRLGYKVFSINTTVRNPKRNTEFLEVLKDFDGKVLTSDIKNDIYVEIVKRGIYKFTNVDSIIKQKYESGTELSDDEIRKALANNPQKTGDEGRLMTQIRAIKDCGFLSLTGDRKMPRMNISPLGWGLLSGVNTEDIYAKAMIGLHTKNPQRTTVYNEARPFLNTIFVINAINDKNGDKKGILWHEFAVFVLSMRDCNYRETAADIMTYREKFGNKKNQAALEAYLYQKQRVNRLKFDSILKDYADDVYRKFDMTGLLKKTGFRDNTYIRFNEYNYAKIESILSEYSNYKFESFSSTENYLNYLNNIVLPWEKNDSVKRDIILKQSQSLGVKISENQSLDDQLIELRSIYNKRSFADAVGRYSINLIKNELKILSRNLSLKSLFSDIPEPVRLEWLVAILFAKTYGVEYVKPNLLLDDNGIPKSHAAGGMADIEFWSDELVCLIEVTMIRNLKQQENSETTSISDHLKKLNAEEKCSLLLAPVIHSRVVDYFRFCIYQEKVDLLALTIEIFIEIVDKKRTIKELKDEIKNMIEKETGMETVAYVDYINNFRAR